MEENTLLNIDSYIYMNHDDITDFNMSNNVTYLGERAFANCKNMRSISFSSNLTTIGPGAFSGCESLEEVILPANVKEIGYRGFADCRRLKKIVIPEGVTNIGWGAFSGCENLEEVILPNSVQSLDKQLFLNCKKLKRVILPNGLSFLPDELFKGCKSLDIVLDSNITELGSRVFEDCYKLSNYPTSIVRVGLNCFRNCRNITNVILNSNMKYLSDGMFDGCVNLSDINYLGDNKLSMGERCFRNCKSMKAIPSFIANYNVRSFENCYGLEEIDLNSRSIPFGCFRGCKNLRNVNGLEEVFNLGPFAFSGCESLEEANLYYVSSVSPEAFSNCKSLRRVYLNNGIRVIGARAFFNCINLSDINLPDVLEVVKQEAFRNCHSIKMLRIPANLRSFGEAAFSFMDSLERIEVDPLNKTFITPDNKILIETMRERLALYASGIKDRSYSMKDYVYEVDMIKHVLVRPIKYISEYAFAGAKNLEELEICCCTTDLEYTAFYGCDNLKKLIMRPISFFTGASLNIRDHGRYFSKEFNKNKPFIPFEEIEITDGEEDENLIWITQNSFNCFDRVKKVTLPKVGSYFIGSGAFKDSVLLERIDIPNNVSSIDCMAFNPNTKLIFENGLSPKGLIKVENNRDYNKVYRVFYLDDDSYYVENGDSIVHIRKKDIDESCYHSELINNNPVLFIDFANELKRHDLSIKTLFSGVLFKNISLENRRILFDNLKSDDLFFFKVLIGSGLLDENDSYTQYLLKDKNFQIVCDYVEMLRKYNIKDIALYSRMFMKLCDLKNMEFLIRNDLDLLTKIVKESDLLDKNSTGISEYILTNNLLNKFMMLVKKYNITDRFLLNKAFISVADNPLFEKLLIHYDANMKRLLKNSKVLEDYSSAKVNLSDLLILLYITGAFNDDEILRQKAETFITEKMFEEKLPNGETNKDAIVGNDIHRIFNFPYIRDEFDLEFSKFFLENYHELINEEKSKSGFIQRIYLNFREISRTATSDKGSQRKLKVTIDKCMSYLSSIKFDGVTKEQEDFATLIGAWYDSNDVWLIAQRVYAESLKAPRNIFTKIDYDEDNNPIYDYDPSHDLREEINDNFSYEWLPKQSYYNLILGKYCNCCAHVNGAGQGIMRASMILDCCQNLVIRNEKGEIIAKATLYVNKEKGYGVFNNIETNMNHRSEKEIGKIYHAFLRGSRAFLNTYNENNPYAPIELLSIGENRNTILEYLREKHDTTPILQALYYGHYSLNNSGYAGDWQSNQRVVLRR